MGVLATGGAVGLRLARGLGTWVGCAFAAGAMLIAGDLLSYSHFDVFYLPYLIASTPGFLMMNAIDWGVGGLSYPASWLVMLGTNLLVYTVAFRILFWRIGVYLSDIS